MLLASRQCLLARRGVAILGRKDFGACSPLLPSPSPPLLPSPSLPPSPAPILGDLSLSLSPFLFRRSFLTSLDDRTTLLCRVESLGESPRGKPRSRSLLSLAIHANLLTRRAGLSQIISRVQTPPRPRYASPPNRHGTARRDLADISAGFR